MAVVELAPSAARTTNGNGPTVSAPAGHDETTIFLDVTAVSGTSPSMTVSVEWSNDGTTWYTSDPAEPMTAVTAVGRTSKVIKVRGDYMRLAWTITGTVPSFTFSVQANVTDFD